MQQAPAAWSPRLFLMTASVWGGVAGALLIGDGAAALASRWSGQTLALVHALTLGFLGNAMLGSLLQFLPVAAGVRVRGGRTGALGLFALLNGGTLLLIVAFRWPQMLTPVAGGSVLFLAFAMLAVLLLPGLLRGSESRFLRFGIAAALMAAVVTALLGTGLTQGLAGIAVMPLAQLTDVHASWGLLGWVLGLLAAVSRVVAPMFQGVRPTPILAQGAWQSALYGLLLFALWLPFANGLENVLRYGAACVGLVFALAGLLLQLRAPRLRLAPLTWFWTAGLGALAAAACVLLASPLHAMLVGVLVLGIGLPLLVTGMQLEIIAFLGWIELQRRCGRGVHLPGVQLLLPRRDKTVVLTLHLLAAAGLLTAVLGEIPTAIAGAGLLVAHVAGFAAQWGPSWRGWQFTRQQKQSVNER